MAGNPIQKSFCTTREAARMLGISLSTAQLWVDSGLLQGWKTDGGHRRIERASIERLLAGSPAATPSAARADRHASVATGRRPFRILVVDDQEDLLKLYRINLGKWPLQPRVITASSAFEAMIKIVSEKPDMMIADLFMPDVDGIRMLRTIRAEPQHKDLPIVVATGLSPFDIAAHGDLPAGIPIFQKPVPFEKLRQLAGELALRKWREL